MEAKAPCHGRKLIESVVDGIQVGSCWTCSEKLARVNPKTGIVEWLDDHPIDSECQHLRPVEIEWDNRTAAYFEHLFGQFRWELPICLRDKVHQMAHGEAISAKLDLTEDVSELLSVLVASKLNKPEAEKLRKTLTGLLREYRLQHWDRPITPEE